MSQYLRQMEFVIGVQRLRTNPRISNLVAGSQINQTQITIIQRAITDGYQLAMSYLTRDGKKGSRTVNPLGMLFGRYAYLVASTGIRAPITYRVDCISDERVVAKTFQEREG